MATATPLLDLDSAASKLGISSLKDKQREAITSFVDGHDVFVSLPTGYGKSLCYTLLPLVFDSLRSSDSHKSIVLVVSPLTALMIDQKHKYASLGMAVEFVGEAQDMRQSQRSTSLLSMQGCLTAVLR